MARSRSVGRRLTRRAVAQNLASQVRICQDPWSSESSEGWIYWAWNRAHLWFSGSSPGATGCRGADPKARHPTLPTGRRGTDVDRMGPPQFPLGTQEGTTIRRPHGTHSCRHTHSIIGDEMHLLRTHRRRPDRS